MTPDSSISIGCRIIAEFDDDASGFASGEPEFVPLDLSLPAASTRPSAAVIPAPSVSAENTLAEQG